MFKSKKKHSNMLSPVLDSDQEVGSALGEVNEKGQIECSASA
jgi:hypothetical protein